jgi:amino acid transporter
MLGIGSAAPAYSIAAALGALLAAAGSHAPGVMLLATIPALALAVAYARLNRDDPECGTSFRWAARQLSPTLGWLSGWASLAADVLVMASLGGVAASSSLRLLGAGDGRVLTVAVGAAWLVAIVGLSTGVRRVGVLQRMVVPIEVLFLVGLAVALLIDGGGNALHVDSLAPWGGGIDLPEAAAIAIFLFWGWETSLSVNEEMRERRRAPGRAGVAAVAVLALVYGLVTLAAVAVPGPIGGGDSVLDARVGALGGPALTTALVAVILLSAVSSAQGTVVPSARTTVSMARVGALPSALATADLRARPPIRATVMVGAVATVWYVAVAGLGENVLAASLGPLSVLISFYYLLTAVACLRLHTRSGAHMAHREGRGPAVAAAVISGTAFAYFLIDAVRSLVAAATAGPHELDSLGPAILAAAVAALGVGLMLRRRRRDPAFFRPRA